MDDSTRIVSPTVEFLQRLRPGGPWLLTAIIPDGGTITVTVTNAEEVDAFVRRWDGQRNLYYTLNPTIGPMTSKPSKKDIAAAEFAHADLDPRADETPAEAKLRYSTALSTFQPIPTAVKDSGNGLQVLWRHKIPLGPQHFDKVEAISLALTLMLGGTAGTQNIDRLLRLPGTTNLPNGKKLREGRVACPTQLYSFNDNAYTLDEFPSQHIHVEQTLGAAEFDIDELPIEERFKNLIRGIDDVAHPYNSRSERVFAVVTAMVRARCSDRQIAAVMAYKIGDHVRDQSNPAKYLREQVNKARQLIGLDPETPSGDQKQQSSSQQQSSSSEPPILIPSGEFVAQLTSPDYLIYKLMLRGNLYSMTGMTGHGKTAIALRIAAHVALGLPVGGLEAEKGRVLYFAGESPDDVRTRWTRMCEVMELDPYAVDIHFMDGSKNLSNKQIHDRIKAYVEP